MENTPEFYKLLGLGAIIILTSIYIFLKIKLAKLDEEIDELLEDLSEKTN